MNAKPTVYDFTFADLIPEPEGPQWLVDLKTRAGQVHKHLGVPTPATEEWKYTALRDLGGINYKPARYEGQVELPPLVEGSVRVVMVDGVFRFDLSTLPTVPGLSIGTLHGAIEANCEISRNHLGAAALIDDHTFAALNTALFVDGVLLHLVKGAMVAPLIEVVHVSATENGICAPRVLIVAEEGSSARIVETYLSSSSGTLTLPVTECFIAKDANVEHVRVQDERLDSRHIGLWQVRQEGSSEYRSYNICFGSQLARIDQSIWLGGPHVTTRLDGVVIGKGTQLLDNHTRLDHAFPHGNSFEIYKQIVDDKATVVFNGQIYVHQDAQKTDAKQTNQALLLSPDATINSKPQLEIFADDVKCTHGATVGAPENDSLFYLRSRGVPLAEAEALLVYAFAAEVIELITVESIRDRLEERLYTKLSS